MRQTERQWGRRGGRKKKLNHYSQLTDRKTDGGTDSEGMRGWSGQIRHLMEREVEDDQLRCHRQKKNTCRNEYWVETLHWFSFCPSVVHQVHHSGPVTCRQKPPGFTSCLFFGLDSSDFAFVTLANFSAVDGWCAPVLIYWGGCFSPRSLHRIHFSFLPSIPSARLDFPSSGVWWLLNDNICLSKQLSSDCALNTARSRLVHRIPTSKWEREVKSAQM